MRTSIPKLLLTLVSVGSPMLCQQAKDVNGWAKVAWGMSVEQAKAVNGLDAEDSTVEPGPNFDFIDKLTLPNVKVGDLAMKASLQVPKGTDQIKQVTLSLKNATGVSRDARSGAFETLKALLIEKYGTPANEGKTPDRDSTIKNILWVLPSTSITLTWNELLRYEIGYVTVTYQAVDKKALDAL